MQLDLAQIHVIVRPTVYNYVELTSENIEPIAGELADFHQPATVVDGVLSYMHPHYGSATIAIGDWVSLNYMASADKYSIAAVALVEDRARYQDVGFPSIRVVTQEN